MKVREKSTGDIIEVTPIMKYSGRLGQYFESVEDEAGRELNLNDVEIIESKDTSIPDCGEGAMYIDPSISYWERLKHQYAGMAMQAYIIISQSSFCEGDMKDCKSIAHALVQELKEKEERK